VPQEGSCLLQQEVKMYLQAERTMEHRRQHKNHKRKLLPPSLGRAVPAAVVEARKEQRRKHSYPRKMRTRLGSAW